MRRFIIRRILYAVLVLWLVSTAVFALLQISPVPVERVIGGPRATTDTLNQIRHNLGLDQPLWRQYERSTCAKNASRDHSPRNQSARLRSAAWPANAPATVLNMVRKYSHTAGD